MTKQRVLIPLDGSGFSEQILEQVRRFLSPDAYEIILLRVSEPPHGLIGAPPRSGATMPFVPEYASARDLEQALHPIYQSQKMESAIANLSDELLPEKEQLEAEGYTVQSAVRFGDAAKEIVEFAASEPVDLIAMTTHGRSGLMRMVAGSVASYVIQHATLPVFLYRPTA